jgi:putative tryptophan/tyrosine transport system substrate-binding protein
MNRRAFISALGGAAAGVSTWPLAARAQQGERIRRIGMLIGLADGDPEVAKYVGELQEGLRALGWNEGKNLRIDHRAAADRDNLRSHALVLAALGAELIVTYSTPAANAVRHAAPGMPIVFTAVSDPIGTGFVESLSRPGGGITGFTNFEASMGGKWLELLHDIAPSMKRAGMVFDPATANAGASGGIYFPSMKAAAETLGVQLNASPVSEPRDIDSAFGALAEARPAGAIVMPNVFTLTHRQRIVDQAARFRVPTVYSLPEFVKVGGLLSYGVDYLDLMRRAASYVDRILRGGKPADLPVQQPTKFRMTVNLKAANELGLTVPLTLQAGADEVIE